MKLLAPLLGQPEDVQRKLVERAERRGNMERMRFWAEERPGDAADVVARMFDDARIEAILIRYLAQEIDCRELGYELQSLAEDITSSEGHRS